MLPESRSTQPPHGHADPERGASGGLGEQRAQTVGGPGQYPGGLGTVTRGVVPQPPLGHHPPAQIEQRDRRIGHGHMDPAHKEL